MQEGCPHAGLDTAWCRSRAGLACSENKWPAARSSTQESVTLLLLRPGKPYTLTRQPDGNTQPAVHHDSLCNMQEYRSKINAVEQLEMLLHMAEPQAAVAVGPQPAVEQLEHVKRMRLQLEKVQFMQPPGPYKSTVQHLSQIIGTAREHADEDMREVEGMKPADVNPLYALHSRGECCCMLPCQVLFYRCMAIVVNSLPDAVDVTPSMCRDGAMVFWEACSAHSI